MTIWEGYNIMGILEFFLSNWDSVLVVLAFIVAAIILIARKQYAILDEILFALVTEAEKKFGSGTGAAKLAQVIDWVYPKIPAVIRLFITFAQLENAVERVLAGAKAKWDKNPSLAAYISTTDG
jgi:hypothetical protein